MTQEREAVACAERIVERTYSCGELEIEAKIVAKALLALRSGGEGWRPIETVPKDGTPIRVQTYDVFRWLAYKPDGARQMKRAGRWQKHDGHGFTNCPDPHGVWQPAEAPSPSTHGEG